MARALLSIAQRTIRFRNTPTTLFGTSWMCAIRRASRIQQSLAKAGVPLLHHSVLVVEAFSSIEKTAGKAKIGATEKDNKLVGDMLELKQRLKRGNWLESVHSIQQIREEAQQTFDLGLLDLESKAKIDSVYWQLATQIVGMHRGLRFIPDEVKELETSLGDQYICNFSVFQSL